MLDIITGDQNPVLRSTCEKVEIFDEKLQSLVAEMQETMLHEDPETGIRGVGLAANQVGINQRIILVSFNVGTKKEQKITPMINPEILSLSPQKVLMEEGCLSIPGEFGEVARPATAQVRWQGVDGKWREKRLRDWDARIFLHEFDHLEGKLFTDYLRK